MSRLLPVVVSNDTGNNIGCESCRLSRRDVLAAASVLGVNAVVVPAVAEPASERPQEGDYLVPVDGPNSNGLSPDDIKGVVIAWPMEPAGKIVRDGSRLNKVLLVRVNPSELTKTTRERSADGVVAYSAICSHAGCEVTEWVDDQKILQCPCHGSEYDPKSAAAIVSGPTTRALAALPLKLVDGKLVVANPFIGRLGIAQT